MKNTIKCISSAAIAVATVIFLFCDAANFFEWLALVLVFLGFAYEEKLVAFENKLKERMYKKYAARKRMENTQDM